MLAITECSASRVHVYNTESRLLLCLLAEEIGKPSNEGFEFLRSLLSIRTL